MKKLDKVHFPEKLIRKLQKKSPYKNRIVMFLSNPYHPDDRVRNEAISLIKAGYEVIILAWDRDCNKPQKEVLDNVEIRRIRIQSGYEQGMKQLGRFITVWKSFFTEAKVLNPQYIHCHDFDTFLAGIFYKIIHKRVKLILDTHENYYLMMKQARNSVAWIINFLEKLFTSYADLLISPCKAIAAHYSQYSKKQSIIVGNWKNPTNYEFSKFELDQKRKELDIEGQLTIAYIGLLDEERNIIPLLQALKLRPSVFLILGGKGDQEEYIREYSSSLNNVYFPGYINPDEVPILTSLADIIYYAYEPTSINAPYNAPNKLYEALAAGKAIIASETKGELSEVVKETKCGILLSTVNYETVGSAIDFLANSTDRFEMQNQAKKAGLNKYNWELAELKLVNAYSSLSNK